MNKSFLKWAGGKSQLLERILSLMPPVNSKGRYIEPFVGSGVIALNVPHESIIIGDINPGLMALWGRLQIRGRFFVDKCRDYFSCETNVEDAYYGFREMFNELTAAKKNPVDFHLFMKKQYAAMFLYLNRHCFNGLCRFNSKGEFNVPFGKYKNPYFPEAELLHAVEVTKRMMVFEQGFEDTMNMAKEGDVIYCDPPYIPLSETSNFTGYSAGGFGWVSQVELAEQAKIARGKGATVIISNNDVPAARELYADATEMYAFQVAKKISCEADGRKKSGEILAVYRP
jgi:DNA adenine methylase